MFKTAVPRRPPDTAMVAPEVTLTHLNRADGSATYTHNGYSVIGAVNGPIEVQRRDELPEEATIEVNVRPAIGVGSPRERHLETLLHSTLRSIILARQMPRSLVQLTLQVRSLPDQEASTGVNSMLTLLPHLLHTSLLALISASIPLSTTLAALVVAIPSASEPLVSPTATQLMRAAPIKSVHVFAFSRNRRLLLNESEGAFTHEEWDEACEMAEDVCCGEEDGGGVRLGDAMDVDGEEGRENLEKWLRAVVRAKVEREQRWKKGP
ncbi:hypothetical protein BDU57DRAFT_510235 [Ampelomyces quisqualis]|uniref:Exoribonuclease phosphorolytic domain-containing protein n=1 Tax=Ampelomyces quisqualis TaxID=50730 RepID=A0A6A5R2P5_AMPQU|nr:hypothetical protein BDU57DRAFT_510235 [Ampelomyces quisqualis]